MALNVNELKLCEFCTVSPTRQINLFTLKVFWHLSWQLPWYAVST